MASVCLRYRVCVVLLAVLLIVVVTVNPPKVVNLGKISAHLRSRVCSERAGLLELIMETGHDKCDV
jgi:hypothetical protein